MKRASRGALAAVLLLGFVGGGIALSLHEQGSGPPPVAAAENPFFVSPESCRECHPAVFAEWEESQHAVAFTNPVVRRPDMADGFRKKDCIPCHAPRPVFEQGLGKSARVLARDVHRAFGVDCLSCHQVGGNVASATPGLAAPCLPVHRAELTTTDLCAPCHNQHLTVDEWEASPAAVRGENCNDCHMPPVERAAVAGRPAKIGRSHRTLGGNDPALLRRSATLTWALAEGPPRALRVTVANTGCAHNLPTDARHRAIDLIVTLLDESGAPIGPAADHGPGERGGTARLRFRNPYRDESGKADTQIPAGESRTLDVPLAAGATQAEIRLLYKRTPYVSDDEAFVVQREVAKLP